MEVSPLALVAVIAQLNNILTNKQHKWYKAMLKEIIFLDIEEFFIIMICTHSLELGNLPNPFDISNKTWYFQSKCISFVNI